MTFAGHHPPRLRRAPAGREAGAGRRQGGGPSARTNRVLGPGRSVARAIAAALAALLLPACALLLRRPEPAA